MCTVVNSLTKSWQTKSMKYYENSNFIEVLYKVNSHNYI